MSSKFPWTDATRLYPRGPQRVYPDIGAGAAGGGGSVLWSPYSLGNQLVAWCNPACIAGNSGDQIQTWSDISGQGNHGTQATSVNRARLVTNHVNSNNTIFFEADSQQRYLIPNVFSASSEGAMYIVCAMNADIPSTTARSGLHGIRGDGLVGHYPFTDGIIYDNFLSTVRKTVGNPSVDMRSFHLAGFTSKSGYYSYKLDAASFFETTSNVVGANSGYSYGSTNSGAGGIVYASVYQSDLVLVSPALSSGDNAKMEGFLAHKHGTQSFLPGTHPYINSPPT